MTKPHRFIKDRETTKKHCLKQIQQRRALTPKSPAPWYRQKHNFFPLLMLFILFVMLIVVKSIYNVQNDLVAQPQSEEMAAEQPQQREEQDEQKEMDYQRAVEIFRGAD